MQLTFQNEHNSSLGPLDHRFKCQIGLVCFVNVIKGDVLFELGPCYAGGVKAVSLISSEIVASKCENIIGGNFQLFQDKWRIEIGFLLSKHDQNVGKCLCCMYAYRTNITQGRTTNRRRLISWHVGI